MRLVSNAVLYTTTVILKSSSLLVLYESRFQWVVFALIAQSITSFWNSVGLCVMRSDFLPPFLAHHQHQIINYNSTRMPSQATREIGAVFSYFISSLY